MFNNVNYKKRVKMSPWRKISLGSWRPTGDSSINVSENIRTKKIFDFIEQEKINGNVNANINSFFSLLFGRLFKDHPEFNVIVRGGRIFERASVDTFFHVAQPDLGGNLSGVLIKEADQKSFTEVTEELKAKIIETRQGKNDVFEKSKSVFSILPVALSKLALDLIGFLNYTLNLNLAKLGVPKDSFGSLMISNVGSLGVREGYSVLAPYTHIPMVVCLTAVEKKVLVDENDQPEVCDTMNICFTIDHRVVDGYHIGLLLKSLRKYCENPSLLNKHSKASLTTPKLINKSQVG